MRHIRQISVSKAEAAPKQDAAGAIFLQIWLTMLSVILSKGFND